MTEASLLERLERVEAQLAIGQLPIRYALAVDGRDLTALVALFTDDVDCGRWGRGRPALSAYFDKVLRQFYRSQHQICGQAIGLIDADRASGRTYCRAEHEDNGRWVAMGICYFDEYVRRDGQWYFERRDERHWYSSDVLERPGSPRLQNWPGKFDTDRYQPRLPHSFPTWHAFWARSRPDEVARLTQHP